MDRSQFSINKIILCSSFYSQYFFTKLKMYSFLLINFKKTPTSAPYHKIVGLAYQTDPVHVLVIDQWTFKDID